MPSSRRPSSTSSVAATARCGCPSSRRPPGFSRFHLARLFHEVTQETLDAFLRRTRLERAAYSLRNGKAPIADVAAECGYGSPEAFARAFRTAFGLLPSAYRRSDLGWQIPSPNDLHWNADYASDAPGKIATTVRLLPAREVAVWRSVGNYARLADGWIRLEVQFRGRIPQKATFVTLYLDNMWTHPVVETMRADLGWVVGPDDPVPAGMRRRILPAGRYATTCGYVSRRERNDAWSYMSGAWDGARRPSYDEYRAWPLPFESVETRIFVRLGDEAP